MPVTDDQSWTGTEIAIVGAAGRFPGARSLAEYWELLREGRESIRQLTDAELDLAGVPQALRTHPQYVGKAAVLDDIGWWDAKFWGFSPKDAAIMDPQHRLFLECAYEALEHAGIAPDQAPGRVGVYAGVGMGSWFQRTLLNNRELMDDVGLFLVRHTGNDKDFLSTRVSYELDLRGPSINVQTACSTSLVAMHLASQALLTGEADVALAGGVTLEMPNTAGYLFKENEILSPDGHCRAFDADSAGTVFGSGAGVVVLRRLQDALDDGDNILAVVRGSAINNDGAGKIGYLAPSVDGQAAAIAEAIEVAGVTADSIDYVEAHGTGTRVGDPIEVAALTQAFRRTTDATGFCGIGSVKTNIGHLDTAAGVAGVLKVVLAMQHGELPASLHFKAPNPLIDFPGTPFVVNGERRPWPARGHRRRAGVSSLGVGGTNAHVVLEQAPEREPSAAPSREWQLLPYSARTETALATMATNLADHLRDATDVSLADAAFTLQVGRLAHQHRGVVVASSHADAANRLEEATPEFRATGTASSGTRTAAFLFVGGGAQHPAMARTLYEREPRFRAVFDEGLAVLDPGMVASIRTALFGDPAAHDLASALLERPSVGLPALLLTEIALARLWEQWGVVPTAMIGHSMGEYAAAHLAGVFSLTDAVKLVALRGRLFEKVVPGSMLSVPMSAPELTPLLPSSVSIAVINAPGLCVASGPTDGIAALEATLLARDVDCRRIRIAVAAHSALLDPILGEFEAFLRTVRFGAPNIPFVSNRSGRWITAAEATDPMYWVRHLRETVNFAAGLEALLEDPDRVLIEVGPGRTLTQLASMHSARRESHALVTSLPSAITGAPAPDDQAHLLTALGTVWTHGVAVSWRALHDEPRQRVPLPTYPWERQRHWIEADAPSAQVRAGDPGVAAAATSDGRRDDVGAWFHEPAWQRTDARETGTVGTVWLLADEPDAVLQQALARLVQDGTRVVRIRSGSSVYAGLSDDAAALRVDAADDWRALLGDAAKAGATPSHVVHAWTSTHTSLDTEVAAFHSLAALGQALAERDVSTPLQLLVLTRNAQDVTGGDLVNVAGSLVLGPVLGLPQEVEQLRASAIDLDAAPTTPQAITRAARHLVHEIMAGARDPVVAWRRGRRWTRGFREVTPAAMPAALSALTIRDGGVYVITGGLGGVGLALAEWIARQARVNLVLLGRRAAPAGAPAVRHLESLGANVRTIAVDVTDAARVADVISTIEREHESINGVIHAAGTLADGLLALKSRADMDAVLAPKVRGVQALGDALGDTALDFFVCCSSVSAMAGLPGQVDYASANAYLDAWCAERAARVSYPVVSLAWSAWRDTGMVARARGTGAALRTPHPLLERQLRDGSDALFSTVLDPSRHWMMDEHRLVNGPSLVPGTGYLEIARAALAPWAAGSALELRDVAFLRPLALDDDAPREMRVAIETAEHDAQFVIAGAVAPGEDGSVWEEHVVGRAYCSAAAAPAPIDLATVTARCPQDLGVPAADPHLAFGPRWHNIRGVRLGADVALITMTLPDAFRDELGLFQLHPALMDMATAGAQRLIPAYDAARDFFVPLSYGRLTVHAALPAEIRSVVTLRDGGAAEPDLAAFDVVITDANGTVLVDIEEFLMTRVRDQAQMTVSDPRRRRRRSTLDLDQVRDAAPAADEPAWYTEAIRPAEGGTAFGLGVQLAVDHPHLLVSPFPLRGLLRRLNAGAAPAPRAAAKPRTGTIAPTLPLETIEQALMTHDAVHAAIVMQRADRTGSVRLVAYVHLHASARATVSELRRGLKKSLAAHLVPSVFQLVDIWPVREDGAVDREALPDPFGTADDFVAPRTEFEVAIAEVWRDVLGVERIGIHDNFFDIGGHSLLGVRAITKLDKRIGVRLNQANMVLQTLEQLAAECVKRAASVPAGKP
ncbi:MAG TPA: SDR family NAD(P)-dependent oxidoreductase [Gemmatimonadaceae bacterium]|nr:SDR family NAD(P)-dependent oxidoreductase [Gemmatimonadaceae bacterium]